MSLISVFFVLFSVLLVSCLASDQSVGVRGQLMCGNQPLANAEVKLWELDIWPNPDDLLSTVYTDSQGRFQVQGTENEMTTIDPVLKIYHNCNNNWRITSPLSSMCKRKVTYKIPSTYISSGRQPNKWYDMGTLNMEAKLRNEDTECIGK